MLWIDLPELLCRYERPIANNAIPRRRRSRTAGATRRAGISRAVTRVCQVVHAPAHGGPYAICANEDVCLRLGSVVEVQHEVGDGAVCVEYFRVMQELLLVVGAVAFRDISLEDFDKVCTVHRGSTVYGLKLSDTSLLEQGGE